ncbi:MAG: phenylalanine--tRNA ligase subunit alpha [Planctomycetes bacterium]|nr:phenylalanine--tRNA ligase subunit alpha [Planctomycetota bacterium]
MGLREDLEAAKATGLGELAAVADAASLEAARVAWLGARSGRMKELKEAFSALPGDQKREFGRVLNEVDAALKEAFKSAQERLAGAVQDAPIDLTMPVPAHRPGSIHPISQVAADIERVFTSMGYEVIDGPHVEEDEFNFGRLNIPADHPARDAQDTFWLSTGKLLRTHTSSVQGRTYAGVGSGALTPPFRRVVVGKVFRYEAVDATHDNTFTQVEGFVVDKGITVAHLVGTIKTMLAAALKRDDVDIRLRPHFFPFVEPGFEVDVRLLHGEGRLAKWMELLGCGMIHPRVLTMGGIDPEQWQGFAFGLGLERLTMVRHQIGDIRLFNGADLRGLRQFT